MADGSGGLARVATVRHAAGRPGADPLRARRRRAEPEPAQQVLRRPPDGRGAQRGQARLRHLRQPRVRAAARHARGPDRRVELQLDLDQLHPGRRHPVRQGPALGHASGSRATRSGLFGLTLQGAYRKATCAAPTPTARRTRRSTPSARQGASSIVGLTHQTHRGRPRPARPRAAPRPDPGRPRARGARLGGLRPPRAQGRRQLPHRRSSSPCGAARSDWRQAVGPGADRQPPARRHAPSRRWCDRWEDSLRARLGPGAGGRDRTSVPIDARDAISRRQEVAARRSGHRRDARRHRRRRRPAQRRDACGWTT